jgi:mannose-6-phosphate isomerase
MYKFEPILKTLVWGSEKWVLSAVPGSESVVSEGPDKGRKITELYPGTFPLLIKFIDAKRDLSIQVHPDDELAARRHNCNGKTEMWYVIRADKGARLLSGFRTQIDPEQYEELVRRDEIVSVLASHDVSEGDVFFLPAGRVHAIGAGCYLAEIQQTSDITYRIYDYNRPGLDGKPRQLHTELAKDAIDYKVYPEYRTPYTPCRDKEVTLVDCPYFKTGLLELDAPYRRNLSDSRDFIVLICMEGEGRVRSAESSLCLKAGETILAFASEGELSIEPSASGMKLLTAVK